MTGNVLHCLTSLLWLLVACSSTAVNAHMALKFPAPVTPVDFSNGVFTSGFCGLEPSGRGGSDLWRLPPLNATVITPLSSGSTVRISWNLHIPHNGGYEVDIYRLDPNGYLGERIACEATFGCDADGTAQAADITLPPGVTCDKCLVRVSRQALDQGRNAMFLSCAVVSITGSVDECQGCSGHGLCVERQCRCESSTETGFWYGDYCEQENECEEDDHCGLGGVCKDVKALTGPRKQCFCKEGWFGPEAVTPGGMSMRKCTHRSHMSLGDHTQWASEYSDSRTSTPTGNMTIYWTVDREAGYIEYAIKAITDAWVGVGVRPEFSPTSTTVNSGSQPSSPEGSSGPVKAPPICPALFPGSASSNTCSASAAGTLVHPAFITAGSEAQPANRQSRHLRRLLAEWPMSRDTQEAGRPPRIPISGACGASMIPSTAHPMVNLDLVVASAVDDAFRVYDAFTFDRSRPLPDARYGGRDDIIDAVGKQTKTTQQPYGLPLTLIKFRKPIVSEDSAADYCYTEGVRYRLAYAYGQSSPRSVISHVRPTSLETGTASNQQFYQPDSLLYHGGSAGNYDSRGHFPVSFDTKQVRESACAKDSLLENGKVYKCKQEQAESYTIYWTADAANGVLDMAVSAPTTAGWVGIGFPSNGAAMIGSQAIIGSPGNVGMYSLTGYTPPAGGWPQTEIEGIRLESLAITRTDSATILEFQRDVIPDKFELAMQALIGAFHRTSDNHFHQHSTGTNQGFLWDPTGTSDNEACPLTSPLYNFWVVHGILMAAGWGVAIPLGVVIAGSLRDKDPAWFQAHRGLNYAGLLCAVAAWLIALVKLGPINFGSQGDSISSAHSVIGMVVMILGVLQPINALFRPHNNNRKTRQIFNWVHWTAGRIAWFGGLVNVLLGIFLFNERDGSCSPTWPITVYAIWVAAYFLIYVGLEYRKRYVVTKNTSKMPDLPRIAIDHSQGDQSTAN